ncbi:hypothetical protein [Terricaulis sp.]|uniref:hypothetical protein n=1 Tax=Terricaulis sp. TaxID=2768686 RepID=UPI00378372B1
MANERDVPVGYAREVRDTVIKSSLTGVAATALVVTIFSPAGLGGMIGTSVASGLGLDNSANAASADAYANLPPYPAPLSATELSDIRGQLASTAASLEITKAATESRIEYIRSIADAGDSRAAPMPELRMPELRGVAPVEAAVAAEPQAVMQPASDGGGADTTVPYRDPNMELAALLFAHENF